jgi:UDP-N-acetylglucosamine transferase subunit ALG13
LILLTLGTHEQPFERAIDLVVHAARGEELVVQHGHTPPRAGVENSTWLPFLEYEELTRLVARADTVVSHAGAGTILTALRLGKVPVVIPRLRRHGEHVDDHQLQITRELSSKEFVVECLDEYQLASALRHGHEREVSELGRGSDRLRESVVAATRSRPKRSVLRAMLASISRL